MVQRGISLPLVICLDACNSPRGIDIVDAETGTKFYWATPFNADTNAHVQQIGWTNYTDELAIGADSLTQFFCGEKSDIYFDSISTAQGIQDIVARQFRCAFLNPLYDSVSKTCRDGVCDSPQDNVVSWSPTIGLVKDCPPAPQGVSIPVKVIGYAKISLVDVYALGPVLADDRSVNCACKALLDSKAAYSIPASLEKAIIVNAIDCKSCDN